MCVYVCHCVRVCVCVCVCVCAQVFSKNLSELETWEMLQPRVAEKNRALRDIQQRTNEVKLEQERIGAEKQQYEDQIRSLSVFWGFFWFMFVSCLYVVWLHGAPHKCHS